MSIELTIAVIGPESKGLVKRISNHARAHEGVWLNNKFVHLQGNFAGLFVLQIPQHQVDSLKQVLADEFSEYQFQFNTTTKPSNEASLSGTITLEGEDRVGLTREITETLENNAFTIDHFASRRFAVTSIGKSVFQANITTSYSEASSPELLVKELEDLSEQIRVEFTPR